MLIDDLLNEAYVITSRLQSDPVDRNFYQNRRMSGGRLLDNLREVLISERILWYRSLIKENINFWKEDLTSENQECVTVIEDILGTRTYDIVESVLDENSAKVTTGYVTIKLIKRSKCGSSKIFPKAGDVDIANDA